VRNISILEISAGVAIFGILFGIASRVFGRKRRLRKYCLEKAIIFISSKGNDEFGNFLSKEVIDSAMEFEQYIKKGCDTKKRYK